MAQALRKWLAPLLTIALLLSHSIIHQKSDIAAAENIAAPAAASAFSQEVIPSLSILEAAGMMGQTVMIQGVIKDANEGSKVRVQDETGELYLSAAVPALREGDVVRVTGKIISSNGRTEIKMDASGIETVK